MSQKKITSSLKIKNKYHAQILENQKEKKKKKKKGNVTAQRERERERERRATRQRYC